MPERQKNMISYIRGSLERRAENFIIIESGGIGYQVFVSPATLARLPQAGAEVKIYTYLDVKEGGIALYGFSSAEEQEMFHKLLTVSGIGPKGALGFLAQLTPRQLIMAILSDDVKTLCQAPGIGRKTAQRLVLELKDKFRTEEALEQGEMWQRELSPTGGTDARFEAIDAMMALGYSRNEAGKAVSAVAAEGMTTEDILKAALKKMVAF